MQVAALAIAGVELSDSDGQLLGEIGVLAQLADPRIWPLAVTQRIAASGASLAEAVTAGLASLCTPQMTGLPCAGFMQFLDRAELLDARGSSVETTLNDVISRRERIPGIGRPVLRADERVPPMLEAMRRHSRDDGPSVALARRIDEWLAQRGGLRVNSAGLCGALLRDMGFAPEAAAAFCLIYFIVPVLAHAASASSLPPSNLQVLTAKKARVASVAQGVQ